jgi:polyphenol oxidase
MVQALTTPFTMNEQAPVLIHADWQAPKRVRAFNTTRLGGVSEAPLDSLNLGLHVQDNPGHVLENRQRVVQAARVPAEPHWMNQVHGCKVLAVDALAAMANSSKDSGHGITPADVTKTAKNDVKMDSVARATAKKTASVATSLKNAPNTSIEADAAFTETVNKVLCVVTADCLPVVITNQAGTKLAVAHAGWKGLASGVLEASLAHFGEQETLHVWLGPAIGPDKFEVGEDVKHAFVDKDEQQRKHFVAHPTEATKHYANLYGLATRVIERTLDSVGSIAHITGGQWCTYTEHTHFFSYRRDGRDSGRMALIAWLSDHE